MIRAVFYQNNGRSSGFSLSGHAGYGSSGEDIVCAAVSSAAELVCNTITDFFGGDAGVTVKENELTLQMKSSCGDDCEQLIRSFRTHLGMIAEEFPGSISISEKGECSSEYGKRR